ncbi:hypothetical protein HPB49_026164 [Dermacentor silvarum]|nr:hypothetical protein HPB49_026164 [Dermacentor silvarum]
MGNQLRLPFFLLLCSVSGQHMSDRESYESGEWSSGQRWADDAPREEVDAQSVSLMGSGACGAFVHGLEDEFLEVRLASLDSLCRLALQFPSFAAQSLDFIVDMFNDEIEEVRLKAIQCLGRISNQIVLREDQLETVLAVLEPFLKDYQSNKPMIFFLARDLESAVRKLLLKFMKASVLSSLAGIGGLLRVDVDNPANNTPLEKVDIGPKCEQALTDSRASAKDTFKFRMECELSLAAVTKKILE